MSDASVLLAAGQEFEYDGRKYHLRPFTLKDEAIYEAWLVEQAYLTVMRNRRVMEDAEYQIAVAAVADHSAAGLYDFIGDIAQKSLASASGVKKVLSMTMSAIDPRPGDPPIDEELIDKLFNDRMRETIDRIQRANSDPKVRAALRREARKARRLAKSS